MSVKRLTISMDEKLLRKVRRAARGTSISSWLSDAAERKLRTEGMLGAITAWEATHGALLQSEVEREARKRRRASAGDSKV